MVLKKFQILCQKSPGESRYPELKCNIYCQYPQGYTVQRHLCFIEGVSLPLEARSFTRKKFSLRFTMYAERHQYYWVKTLWKCQAYNQIRKLGLTLWNLSCLEFKFDDTRLSYWHKNKIGRIEIFFCCFLTLLIFCPVGLLSFAETANRAEN